MVGWTHSVEKTRWEERYRIEGSKLALIEARIEGSGAGMDPPPEARLRNGWLTWRPHVAPLDELRLTLSPFASDYDICWRRQCHKLRRIVARSPLGASRRDVGNDPIAVVEIRACNPLVAH